MKSKKEKSFCHCCYNSFLEEIEYASIAIGKTHKFKSWHTGIIYKDKTGGGEVLFLELAKNNKLINSSPRNNYAWIVPNIPWERVGLQLIAICKMIWEKFDKENNMMPYGFRYKNPETKFDSGH